MVKGKSYLNILCKVVCKDDNKIKENLKERDGITTDIWGARRKKIKIPFGYLEEYASYPLESAGDIECPQCGDADVKRISEFGSTACKALYQCRACLEPFDYFKCL